MFDKQVDVPMCALSQLYITKRLNVSELIISTSVFFIGMALLIVAFGLRESVLSLKIALFLSAFTLIFYSLFRITNKSKETIYIPTGSVITQHSLFFDLKHLDQLKEGLHTANFTFDSGLNNDNGGNIRMDVILSRDKQFAAVQLFQFVPYEYRQISEVSYYTNGEARTIANFIAKCI